MYKVEFINKNKVLISKEFENYENAYKYSDELIEKLEKNCKILIVKRKYNKWFTVRSLELEI